MTQSLLISEPFQRAIDALITGDPAAGSPATVRAAVVDLTDRWLLRTMDHQSNVGSTLLIWCLRRWQGVTGDDALRWDKFTEVYAINGGAISQFLARTRTYSILVSDTNPEDALNDSGTFNRDIWNQLCASTGLDEVRVGQLAEGFHWGEHRVREKFYYVQMPLRAALLQALFLASTAGSGGLSRVCRLAAQTTSRFFNRMPEVPSREFLGILFAEAVDDELYTTWLSDTNERALDGSEVPWNLHGPAGPALLNLALTQITPPAIPPWNKPAAEHFRQAIAEDSVHTVTLTPDPNAPTRPRLELGLSREVHLGTNGSATLARAPRLAFGAILVPGFTDPATRVDAAEVSAPGKVRCDKAVRMFRRKLAPIVIVSGANVYPLGTRRTEAQLMYKYLIAHAPEKLQPEEVLLEWRARHSTTNLRNAVRLMLGVNAPPVVLISTGHDGSPGTYAFDQLFYFSNPTLSTFNARCDRDLGYHPHRFMGSLRDYLSYLDGLTVEDLRGDPVLRWAWAGATLNRTLLDDVADDYAVAIATDACRRESLRDLLDP